MLGEFIKEKREEKCLTQQRLAEQLNVSISYINLIEMNKRRIGKNKIDDFSKVLNIPKKELISNNIIPTTIEKEKKNQEKVLKIYGDLDVLIKTTEETLVYLKKARENLKLANNKEKKEEDV